MEVPKGILIKLSFSQGLRDESANIRLAKSLAENKDQSSILELVEGLKHKNKGIQNSCIKVLYEIGAIHPELISKYVDTFLALLNHKNNRLQWGSMYVLQCIVLVIPDKIYKSLPVILNASKNGSVITKDGSIQVLISLASVKKFHKTSFDLLLELLHTSLPNQTPMYAERILPLINASNAGKFISVLQSRLKDFEKVTQKNRLEKIINRSWKIEVSS